LCDKKIAIYLYHTSYPLLDMGKRITIYLSEPSEAILNELEGKSASEKVRVALDQINPNKAAIQHSKERLAIAYKRQILEREKLLARVLKTCKIKPVLKADIEYILEGF